MNKKQISREVYETTMEGVRKGWLEPQGMTVTEYLAKPVEEIADIPVRATERGKKEMGDDNVLALYNKLQNKQAAFIRDIHMDDDGNVTMELTEEGQRAKEMAEILGLDFVKHMRNIIGSGTDRLFSQFILLDKKQIMDGRNRLELQRGYRLSDKLIKQLKEAGALDE
jgi:hypothetical protein